MPRLRDHLNMSPARTVIDHVIYAVRDLNDGIEHFESEYGLLPLARSSHPQWGTCNAVVPVGYGQFLELLAIEDPTAGSPLVTGLKSLLAHGDRMAGVCLRPPDIEAVARRLSLPTIDGERHEEGRVLRFRRTVVESRPQLPFFIDWQGAEAEMDVLYGQAAITSGVSWIEVDAQPEELRAWIDDTTVPVRAVPGPVGPRRFALRQPNGNDVIID